MLLIFSGSALVVTPTTLSFSDPVSAAQTISITGGAAPYSISTGPNTSIVTASLSSSTVTVTPVGGGSTSLTISDSAGSSQAVTISVGAPVTLSPSSLQIPPPTTYFTGTGTFTIVGGRAPFTAISNNVTVATVSVSGNTITVTSVAAGGCTVTVTDADGETYNAGVTVAFISGRVLDFSVQATQQHYIGAPAPVQGVIDSNSNIKSTEFPGGLINGSGELFNADGVSSNTTYNLVTGQPFSVSADIAAGSVGSTKVAIALGDTNNGYGIKISVASGLQLVVWVAGVQTVLATAPFPMDNNYHTLRLTVTVGATNNIEGSADSVMLSASDSSLNLSGQAWPITLYTAGEAGSVLHYQVAATPSHYGFLPPRILPIIIPPWTSLPADNVPIASGLLTGRHLLGASGTDTSALADSLGQLLHTRMSGGVKGAVDTSSNILTTRFSGQTVLQNSGTYAGWELCTQGAQSSVLQTPNAVVDSNAISLLNAGDWIWTEWTALDTDTSTHGYGAGFVDGSGHLFMANHFSGAGSLEYSTSSGWTVLATLASNNANTFTQAHTFRFGIQRISSSSLRFVSYCDGVKTADTTAASVGFTQPFRPAFYYDNANKVYIKNFSVTGGTAVHENMPSSIQSTLSSAGVLLNSTLLNTNVPNSSSFFTDFTIEWSTSGTSPNITLKIWYDNGTASTAAKLYLPNYTTTVGDRDISLGFTTSASPSKTITGLASNATVYVLAYYTPGSGMTFQAQTSAFTISQIRTAVQDGGYVAAYATLGTGASFSIGSGGGTGGSVGGNGGKVPRQ